MSVPLGRLPRFLVMDPASTVRLEIHLDYPSCEIDVELQNPRPGRSFVLMIGPPGGPFVQRVRLSGRARVVFQPPIAGDYVLVLANPQKEPLVLKLKGRHLRPHRARRVDERRRPVARSPRERRVRRPEPSGHRRRRSARTRARHVRMERPSGVGDA